MFKKFLRRAGLTELVLYPKPFDGHGVSIREEFGDGATEPACDLVLFNRDYAARASRRVKNCFGIKRFNGRAVEHESLYSVAGERVGRRKRRVAERTGGEYSDFRRIRFPEHKCLPYLKRRFWRCESWGVRAPKA